MVTFRSADGAKKDGFEDGDLIRQRLGRAYDERYMAMDDEDLRFKINQSPLQKRDHVTKQNLTEITGSMSVDQITDQSSGTARRPRFG